MVLLRALVLFFVVSCDRLPLHESTALWDESEVPCTSGSCSGGTSEPDTLLLHMKVNVGDATQVNAQMPEVDSDIDITWLTRDSWKLLSNVTKSVQTAVAHATDAAAWLDGNLSAPWALEAGKIQTDPLFEHFCAARGVELEELDFEGMLNPANFEGMYQPGSGFEVEKLDFEGMFDPFTLFSRELGNLDEHKVLSVWHLGDVDDDALIDADEFTLVAYLCKLASEDEALPDPLPEELIPPALRTELAPMTALEKANVKSHLFAYIFANDLKRHLAAALIKNNQNRSTIL